MTTRGKFITLEGIEGVGKTTQLTRIAAALRGRGVELAVTREPGGTPLAEKIRDLVLEQRDEAMPPSAELLLMFAARAVHLANHVEPNLRKGHWVICDRFTDATYAYQGGGRGVNVDHIGELERQVQGTLRPDLTLLLDAPVAQGMARARTRNGGSAEDRFETEQAEFFDRVRGVYLARATAEPQRFAIIDATQPLDSVTDRLLAAIEATSWIT